MTKNQLQKDLKTILNIIDIKDINSRMGTEAYNRLKWYTEQNLTEETYPKIHPEYYLYELQAFAFSDFEHHLLLHKEKFSRIEFRKILELARQKAYKIHKENPKYYKGKLYYPIDVIKVLREDYGFVESEHLKASMGCNHNDPCEVYRDEWELIK